MALFLSSCSSIREDAAKIAAHAGLDRTIFQTKSFSLVGFMRGHADVLMVFIEGDGLAWVNRTTLSADPTPYHPVGLALAASEPGPAVAYLARPCQYVEGVEARGCDPRYWSSHRFSPEVISATTQAVNDAQRQAGATKIVLVGYSGGGVLATLVASGRSDVISLITIAAPLDITAWTNHHDITPLSGSVNPATLADRLAKIPQIHFFGGNDRVVPLEIGENFLKLEGKNSAGRIVIIADNDHACCWAQQWHAMRQYIQFPSPGTMRKTTH